MFAVAMTSGSVDLPTLGTLAGGSELGAGSSISADMPKLGAVDGASPVERGAAATALAAALAAAEDRRCVKLGEYVLPKTPSSSLEPGERLATTVAAAGTSSGRAGDTEWGTSGGRFGDAGARNVGVAGRGSVSEVCDGCRSDGELSSG